jgi:hypothetical protein
VSDEPEIVTKAPPKRRAGASARAQAIYQHLRSIAPQGGRWRFESAREREAIRESVRRHARMDGLTASSEIGSNLTVTFWLNVPEGWKP